MNRFVNLISVFVLSAAVTVSASLKDDVEAKQRAHLKADDANLFGQVILYHASADKVEALRSVLNDANFQSQLQNNPDFVNERILEAIDELSFMFATYTKFKSPQSAAEYLRQRLDAVQGLTRRPPEHHLVAIEKSFMPGKILEEPSGTEFGQGRKGQNAHIGLFIPQPDFTAEYFETVEKVKVLQTDRKPKGWLGDDLASSLGEATPGVLAPFSAKPRKASVLSFNYGEYDTFLDAEEAYLNRANSGDPDLLALNRIFYGTLQVPSRYFIFKVLNNYSFSP